jgi:leucyl-tRNA synthetase
LTVKAEITIPVQVNGRKRADLTIDRDAEDRSVTAAALALDAVQRAINNKPVKKVIVVPQRIVNVVV